MNEVQLFEQKYLAIFQKLAEFKKQQELMKKQESEFKEMLEKAMDDYGIDSINNEYLTISRVKGSTTTSIDLKALEKKEPKLYGELIEDYPKVTTRKPYVKFTVK